MEQFKLGKTKKVINMPSGWYEVPFYKGVEIFEGKLNDVEILALLADSDVDDIRNATDTESIFYLLSAFRFLRELPQSLKRPHMPKSINIDDNHVIFPHVIYGDKFDLGNACVGQITDMEMILLNMGTEFREDEDEENKDRPFTELETIKMCPPICAVYIQKIIDKAYDYEKAMKLSKNIEKHLSFDMTLNIGYFFLKKLIDLNDGKKADLQKHLSIARKLRRGLMNLMSRLGLTLH